MTERGETFRYDAFISYRQVHPDSVLASRLHRALESYRVPQSLVKKGVPRHLGRVFRDREELAASSDLQESIRAALERSRFLIVVCSRQTPASKWVAEEVEVFIRQGRRDNILCLLVDGEPAESLPRPLLSPASVEADDSGACRVTGGVEPLAADVRAARLADSLRLLRAEKLRLLAPVLGCSYDDLARREHKRSVRRMRIAATVGVAVLILVLAGVTAYIDQRREARRRRVVSTIQTLTSKALQELDADRDTDTAAFLAYCAYCLNNHHRETRLAEIDEAFRKILGQRYFSVPLKGDANDTRLTSAAFSRTGQLLAVGGSTPGIQLWDMRRPWAPPVILPHRWGTTRCIQFSPKTDLLAAATEDSGVLLWYGDQNGQYHDPNLLYNDDSGRATSIAISPDGQRIASACADGRVRIWDLTASSRVPIVLPIAGRLPRANSLAFHPQDSRVLASGHEDARVRIWNLQRPESPINMLPERNSGVSKRHGAVSCVAFSPSGSLLAVGTARSIAYPSLAQAVTNDLSDVKAVGGTIWLWDLEKRDPNPRALEGHQGAVASLAFHRDGTILASAGSEDRTLWLWRIGSPEVTSETLRRHDGSVCAVAFSPDGSRLASVDWDQALVRLWHMGSPVAEPARLGGFEAAIRSLAFDPNGTTLASAGWGAVWLWDPEKKTPPVKLDHGDESVVAVAYSPNGRMIATAGKAESSLDLGYSVRLWCASAPSEPCGIPRRHLSRVHSFGFASSGYLLVPNGYVDESTGSFRQEIAAWRLDASNGAEQRPERWPIPVEDPSCMAFGPGGGWAACGDHAGSVYVWPPDQPGRAQRLKDGHKGCINAVAFDPRGRWLVSGADDKRVCLWDLQKRTPKPSISEHGDTVWSVAVDKSGSLFASAGADGKVKIWDMDNPTASPIVLSQPGIRIYAVAFSPDGRWVAAGTDIKEVVAWPRTHVLAQIACERAWRHLREGAWRALMSEDIARELEVCQFLRDAGRQEDRSADTAFSTQSPQSGSPSN